MNDIEYLSVEEIAKLLRTTEVVIRSAIKSGKMHAVMVGREYRVTRQALDAYLTRQTNAGRAKP